MTEVEGYDNRSTQIAGPKARLPCSGRPPAYCELEVPVSGFCWSELDDPAPLDWLVVVDCEVEELGLVVVDCCSALAPLVTLCEPLPTFTPGLTFAPAFTLELSMPTFAPTPTSGFTFVLLEAPEVPELPEVPEPVVPLVEPDD